MGPVPLIVRNLFAIPDKIPMDRSREIIQTQTLTHDEMKTYHLDISILYDMGINFRHLLWHWGEPPAANNIIWENIRENPEVLKEIKYALLKRSIAERFPQLDWFSMGLTVHDILYLNMQDPETLTIFNVDIFKLLSRGAWEHGRVWHESTKWKEKDLVRLGYTAENFEKYITEQKRRDPRFSTELARDFIGKGTGTTYQGKKMLYSDKPQGLFGSHDPKTTAPSSNNGILNTNWIPSLFKSTKK